MNADSHPRRGAVSSAFPPRVARASRAPSGPGSAPRGVLGEDALDRVRVVGGDRGAHGVADVEHESDVLPRAPHVEVPPVHEVARTPDPPLAHLVRAGQRKPLDASDRAVADPLAAPRVVAANGHRLVVAANPAVLVCGRPGLAHRLHLLVSVLSELSAFTGSFHGVCGVRMNSPATFSSASNATRAFMAPAS